MFLPLEEKQTNAPGIGRESIQPLDEASKLLLKAADLIEEWGHYQGADDKPGTCAILGIVDAYLDGPDDWDAVRTAQERLCRHLSVADNGYVMDWNDRTPTAEVLATMRSVALGG